MNANNSVILMGRLTADVEVKKTSNDVSTAMFNIAVDRPKTKNQPEPGADFPRIKVWRGTADWLARNIGKGTMLTVMGAYRTDRWTDQNGQQREMTYIEAEDVRVADPGAIKRPANYVAPDQRGNQQPQAPQGYAQQAGYPQQAPQGYAPQQMPQNYVPQPQYAAPAPAYNGAPQGYPQQAPQGYAPQQMQYPGPGTAYNAPPAGYGGEGDFTPIPDGDLPF